MTSFQQDSNFLMWMENLLNIRLDCARPNDLKIQIRIWPKKGPDLQH